MSDHINTEEVATRQEISEKKPRHNYLGRFILLFVFILIVAFIYLAKTNLYLRNSIYLVSDFIKAPITKVNSYQNRTNVLVMGVGGKDHEGGDLTDTMILVSISLTKNGIVMISVPRDVWVPDIRAKVNSAYHYGGMALAKSTIEKVLGVPVHYGVILDFSGFKDIVDALGGITVNVENSFTDNLYPIAGKEKDLCNGDRTFKCRYEVINFRAGSQVMDGDTALKFVRSRHAIGDEGTDTAREARQQKVIGAIESKLLDPRTFLNPQKDLAVIKVIMKSIETDTTNETGAVLVRKMFDSRREVARYLIPESLLVNPKPLALYDKQYVFIPKLGNGKWTDIHKWVGQVLSVK